MRKDRRSHELLRQTEHSLMFVVESDYCSVILVQLIMESLVSYCVSQLGGDRGPGQGCWSRC